MVTTCQICCTRGKSVWNKCNNTGQWPPGLYLCFDFQNKVLIEIFLKIASEKLFGDFCTVGGIYEILSLWISFISMIIVIISAGPRFEGKYINGVSHFLEKLAFMVRKESKKSI